MFHSCCYCVNAKASYHTLTCEVHSGEVKFSLFSLFLLSVELYFSDIHPLFRPRSLLYQTVLLHFIRAAMDSTFTKLIPVSSLWSSSCSLSHQYPNSVLCKTIIYQIFVLSDVILRQVLIFLYYVQCTYDHITLKHI